jgi:hypothetical protein
MYADDIILVSKYPKGMQKSIDMLHDYCIDWGLEINVEKTKYMAIYDKLNSNLLLNHKKIEKVDQF